MDTPQKVCLFNSLSKWTFSCSASSSGKHYDFHASVVTIEAYVCNVIDLSVTGDKCITV